MTLEQDILVGTVIGVTAALSLSEVALASFIGGVTVGFGIHYYVSYVNKRQLQAVFEKLLGESQTQPQVQAEAHAQAQHQPQEVN